jgi:hypothetical protein
MGKNSGYKFPSGTWVERELFKSKAFIALKGVAPQVLILFLGKRQMRHVELGGKKRWTCLNRDSISFTYVEAEKKYGITKSRFSRALEELLAKGFITCKHRGGGYQQDKSIYALSDKWRFWSPGTVLEKREKESVQRGFCRPNKERATSKIVPLHDNENVPQKVALE